MNGNVGCCGDLVKVRPSTLGLGVGLTVDIGATDVDAVEVDIGKTLGDTVGETLDEALGDGVADVCCGNTEGETEGDGDGVAQAEPPCHRSSTVLESNTPFG